MLAATPTVSDRLRALGKCVPNAARLWVDGRVTRVVGIVAEASLEGAAIGDLCFIETPTHRIPAEVTGFSGGRVLLMPQGELRGVAAGAPVIRRGATGTIDVGDGLLGRTIDGFGRPLDATLRGPLPRVAMTSRSLDAAPMLPLDRRPVDKPMLLGIRVLDGLLTCGEGQRLGILAGPGVGKTVLLSMIAQRASCDVLVMALIGERGREVAEFVTAFSPTDAASRAVIVAATSDRPPLERLRAASAATAIAEHFRDQGRNVLLVMDSLSRVAMAQREVGLAMGEPPTTKGYPPSVFARMPALLERAGARRGSGSITGIYTVLVEGDDLSDPVGDAAMALLDGQVVLSRRLAGMGHFPAVDVLRSTSRVMNQVADAEHIEAARRARQMLGLLADNEDLVNIGAYEAGRNPLLDHALSRREDLNAFLRQGLDEQSPPAEAIHWLTRLGAPRQEESA